MIVLKTREEPMREQEQGQADLSVVIVAPPSRLRDGLQALIKAVPQVGSRVQTEDSLSLQQASANDQPSLVVLDAGLPDEGAWTALRDIRACWPRTRCIVLADSDQQRRKAAARGADAVLVRGFTGTMLVETIAEILPAKGG
jgi:DNA-binding NarL/FixJ family response regulator